MPENVLYILHNATTLLFGVYISAAFLGIRRIGGAVHHQ